MTVDSLLAATAEDVLATWWVRLNRWEWPEDCPVPCPAAWTTAQTDQARMAAGQDLWQYLTAHTTERARSRAWWLLVLHRTEEAWDAYWVREEEGAARWRQYDAS